MVSAVESMWSKSGPVAQRIRHLTTNQGIAGSSPARVKIFLSMKILSTRGTIIPPESGVLNTTYQKTKSLQPKLGVLVVPPEAPSLWHGKREKNIAPLGGLEPPASRLTAERASRLRHRGMLMIGWAVSPMELKRLSVLSCF